MKKECLKHTLIYYLFALLSLLATYPLILKINNHIPGFYSTDEPYAALWNFWWLKYAWIRGLPSYDYSTLAVPFGINLIKFNIFPLWGFINKWLIVFANNIIAYNLEVLLSFFLAGLFMYYLVYSLTKNRLSGIFSGIIYAFCPYHFVRAWQHLGLAQIQWMPLYLLSLIVLIEKRNIKKAFFSAICFYLVVSFDFYYVYFMFITTIILMIFFILFSGSEKEYKFRVFKTFFIMGLIILVSTSSILFEIARGTNRVREAGVKSEYGPVRPFKDLFSQSAKPLGYLLPAPQHPVFGKISEQFVGTSLYGVSLTEHTLYLGWIPFILAFIAFRRWRKRNKGQSPWAGKVNSSSGDSPLREDFYIGFFIFLTIAAWLFSQPPWWNILGLKVYMPSFLMYKILPMFRAYCRFGIVVMLAVAVLAGFGLKFILEKFKTQKTKIALTCLFSGFVLFEFWNWPPYKVIDVSKVPQVYYWLKEQPGDFVISEYPLDVDGANVMYMFYQTKHEKKIINGTIPGTSANKVAQTIKKLSEPKTAGRLKGMGVRYALVHRDGYLETELIEEKEELGKIPHNPGLKLIKTFPPQECPQKDIMCVARTGSIDVYEVVAIPSKPEVEE